MVDNTVRRHPGDSTAAAAAQSPADARPAVGAATQPMADAVHKQNNRKRMDGTMATIKSSVRSGRPPGVAATDPLGAASGAGAAGAEAGTQRKLTPGGADPASKRSPKRKQRPAEDTHANGIAAPSDSPPATVAAHAQAVTDEATAAVSATRADAGARGHEAPDKEGGRAERVPKPRRRKVGVEQPGPQPPQPSSAELRVSDTVTILPAATGQRSGAATARTGAVAAPQRQRINSEDASAAEQPKAKKARVAPRRSHAAKGSASVPSKSEAAAPVAVGHAPAAQQNLEGRAAPLAAHVVIHGDGPAWRDHATRSDVRTGRYSEAEKQTIRDAVAECVCLLCQLEVHACQHCEHAMGP